MYTTKKKKGKTRSKQQTERQYVRDNVYIAQLNDRKAEGRWSETQWSGGVLVPLPQNSSNNKF